MPRSIVAMVKFRQFDNRETDGIFLTEIVGRWNKLRILVVVGLGLAILSLRVLLQDI